MTSQVINNGWFWKSVFDFVIVILNAPFRHYLQCIQRMQTRDSKNPCHFGHRFLLCSFFAISPSVRKKSCIFLLTPRLVRVISLCVCLIYLPPLFLSPLSISPPGGEQTACLPACLPIACSPFISMLIKKNLHLLLTPRLVRAPYFSRISNDRHVSRSTVSSFERAFELC